MNTKKYAGYEAKVEAKYQGENLFTKELEHIRAKLFIPSDIVSKIQLMCLTNYNIEWQGLLFYKSEVSSPAKNKVEILMTAVELIPIATGTGAAVSATLEKELIELYDKYEHLQECKYGLIHSHNTMAVFFSTTDITELINNVDVYETYLSVIVNNNLDVVAKIAIPVKENIVIRKTGYAECKNPITGESLRKTIATEESTEETIGIETFDVNVEMEEPEESAFTEALSVMATMKSSPKYPSYNTGYDPTHHWQPKPVKEYTTKGSKINKTTGLTYEDSVWKDLYGRGFDY